MSLKKNILKFCSVLFLTTSIFGGVNSEKVSATDICTDVDTIGRFNFFDDLDEWCSDCVKPSISFFDDFSKGVSSFFDGFHKRVNEMNKKMFSQFDNLSSGGGSTLSILDNEGKLFKQIKLDKDDLKRYRSDFEKDGYDIAVSNLLNSKDIGMTKEEMEKKKYSYSLSLNKCGSGAKFDLFNKNGGLIKTIKLEGTELDDYREEVKRIGFDKAFSNLLKKHGIDKSLEEFKDEGCSFSTSYYSGSAVSVNHCGNFGKDMDNIFLHNPLRRMLGNKHKRDNNDKTVYCYKFEVFDEDDDLVEDITISEDNFKWFENKYNRKKRNRKNNVNKFMPEFLERIGSKLKLENLKSKQCYVEISSYKKPEGLEEFECDQSFEIQFV